AARLAVALPQPQSCVARGHSGERLPVLVEGQQGDDRERRDAANRGDCDLQLAQVVEGLDEEQVDPARVEDLRLLRKELESHVFVVSDVAERTARPGYEYLGTRDLPRLARDLHRLGVDALDLVLEEPRGELAAVGTEGVRIHHLRPRT